MLTRGLPLLLLLLIPPAIGQTSEQNPDAKDSSMLGSFLDAGMPEEVLFAVRKPSIDGHWYANIAYYSTDQCRTTFPMNSGGKLCIYNVRTKEVRTIFEDPEGNVRDPQIHHREWKTTRPTRLPAGTTSNQRTCPTTGSSSAPPAPTDMSSAG